MIESAGGVVWRATHRLCAVVVIHRPARQDWSLPKGRRRPQESALDCALREVREETGFHCRPGSKLPEVRYTDGRGRPRRIRYWAMEALHGEFQPNEEVDEIRWTALDQVGDLLTRGHDVVVVTGLLRVVPVPA